MQFPEMLKGDTHSNVYVDWWPWLVQTSQIVNELRKKHQTSSFYDHEVAIVSTFVAGAARCGYLPLAEFKVERGEKRGRCDLWVKMAKLAYYFEFKNTFSDCGKGYSLKKALDESEEQLRRLSIDEGEKRVAVIVSATEKVGTEHPPLYVNFCAHVDYAFRFGRPDRMGGAYVYFKLIDSKETVV